MFLIDIGVVEWVSVVDDVVIGCMFDFGMLVWYGDVVEVDFGVGMLIELGDWFVEVEMGIGLCFGVYDEYIGFGG